MSYVSIHSMHNKCTNVPPKSQPTTLSDPASCLLRFHLWTFEPRVLSKHVPGLICPYWFIAFLLYLKRPHCRKKKKRWSELCREKKRTQIISTGRVMNNNWSQFEPFRKKIDIKQFLVLECDDLLLFSVLNLQKITAIQTKEYCNGHFSLFPERLVHKIINPKNL